ncbi:helix-turn-helix transcriptional regulator [Paraburkholderia graminis]|uniref:helix-turn-helix transcriptional regulator n=1 Tax=Paraburkholderia graminis TaxID=60548 RepID=UPI0031D802C3
MSTAKVVVGADAGCFMVWNKCTSGLESFVQLGHEAAAESEYLDHYSATDVVAKKAVTLPVGVWLSSDWLLSQAQWEQQEFYVDFLQRFRIGQIFGFALVNDDKQFAALAFQCHTTNHHVRAVVAEQPMRHLQRTLIGAYKKRVQAVAEANQVLSSLIENASEAVCVVLRGGHVDFLSPAVNEWLVCGKHLSVRSRRLMHADPKAHQRLLATIEIALQGGAPQSTVLPGRWGETFHVQATLPSRLHGAGTRKCVVVRIQRRDIFTVPTEVSLRETFNLTAAEGRVFRELIAGHDASACASVLNVAEGTVRKQISSLLKKTSCNRQSELIRLASLV